MHHSQGLCTDTVLNNELKFSSTVGNYSTEFVRQIVASIFRENEGTIATLVLRIRRLLFLISSTFWGDTARARVPGHSPQALLLTQGGFNYH